MVILKLDNAGEKGFLIKNWALDFVSGFVFYTSKYTQVEFFTDFVTEFCSYLYLLLSYVSFSMISRTKNKYERKLLIWDRPLVVRNLYSFTLK